MTPGAPTLLLVLLMLLPLARAQHFPGAKTYGTCGTRLDIAHAPGAKPVLTTFDLSQITGEEVSYHYTDQEGNDFYFSPCNDVPNLDCPVDPEHAQDPVIGMGMSQSDLGCDVLGQWGADGASWSALLDEDSGKVIGIQLHGGEGATCHVNQKEKYSLTTNFNCYVDEAQTVKASLQASDFLAEMGNECNPVYQINTCLACPDGCGASPPAPMNTPSSSSSNPGKGTAGVGWFGVLCIVVFVVVLPLYVGVGFILRSRQGLSGLAALPPPLDKCAGSSNTNSSDLYQNSGSGYGTSDFDSI